MIFCFSGTGNSLYVASRVAKATKEEIIMITESERRLQKSYILNDAERLGFIFPIYWWGMPLLVEEFVKNLKLDNYNGQYTYAIATFGLGSKNGVIDLKDILKSKKIMLTSNFEVKMVDNYIVGYEVANEEKQKKILLNAENQLNQILPHIMRQETVKVKDYIGRIVKPIVHHFYKSVDHHKKFYTTDSCIGCSTCEKNCPCNSIKMAESKPTWLTNCSFCLKCINCCPKQAIQYGKGTEGRTRYYNSNI